MADNYLFLFAVGRSGSTLVQHMLNSIDGYLVRGENRAAVNDIVSAAYKIKTSQIMFPEKSSADSTGPWFGIHDIDGDELTNNLRNVVVDQILKPKKDTRVLGAKEIRWQNFEELEKAYSDMFPGCRFVLNIRNPEHVGRSKWWRELGDGAVREVQKKQGQLEEYVGDNAFKIYYDKYTKNIDDLIPLFDWLGEEFDRERLKKVMATRCSY